MEPRVHIKHGLYGMHAGASKKLFIALAGIIGAGKTRLAHALAAEMGLPVCNEPVDDNEYLADFYTDMARHGFAMQVALLTRRFEQQQQIVWTGAGAVQDRSIYEDSIFAKMLTQSGHIDERNLATYQRLFACMANFMPRPNLIVYLRVSPETSLARIRARGRPCEAGISLEYLRALHAAYEEFITDIALTIPVICVDWDEFRPAAEVAAMIEREYREMQKVRKVMA